VTRDKPDDATNSRSDILIMSVVVSRDLAACNQVDRRTLLPDQLMKIVRREIRLSDNLNVRQSRAAPLPGLGVMVASPTELSRSRCALPSPRFAR
jgi:hypothetical protein